MFRSSFQYTSFGLNQARPEIIPPDESDLAGEEEEKEVDLSVPGSSYIKLLALTPSPVLPGKKCFSTYYKGIQRNPSLVICNPFLKVNFKAVLTVAGITKQSPQGFIAAHWIAITLKLTLFQVVIQRKMRVASNIKMPSGSVSN